MPDKKKIPEKRSAVKKGLIASLNESKRKNPAYIDLISDYLDARDRMIDAKDEYLDAKEAGLSTADLMPYSQEIERETRTMGQLMTMLGITRRSERRDKLKAEIDRQLKNAGLNTPIFTDKADQYMRLWDAFQTASESLIEKGRTYVTISSAGKEYEKDNSATKELISLTKAMQDAAADLGISVEGCLEAGEDEL